MAPVNWPMTERWSNWLKWQIINAPDSFVPSQPNVSRHPLFVNRGAVLKEPVQDVCPPEAGGDVDSRPAAVVVAIEVGIVDLQQQCVGF